jgi:hypothetical protein
MVGLDDVERMIVSLPEVEVGSRYGNRTWFVEGKGFAWERPFSRADLRRFGDATPPEGPILAVSVEDLAEKEAVLAAGRAGFFTIPHFDGYPAVLVQLDVATEGEVWEALVDGWLACAPPSLAEEHAARLVEPPPGG